MSSENVECFKLHTAILISSAFSRQNFRVQQLLDTHSLADFDFHDHRPAV